jgi:putative acetyltransferase
VTDLTVALRAGWSLRLAVDEDADALRQLIEAVFGEYPGCVLEPDGLDADLASWCSYLAGLGGTGWVVTDADDVVMACVGVAPVVPDATDPRPATPGYGSVELKRLYVAASARRRGLGSALVGLVEEWAIEQGHNRVELWSDSRFADAHALYTRMGYLPTGDARELHDISRTTELRFDRQLS